MKRLARSVAVTSLVCAALIPPAAAHADPDMICPDEFQPFPLLILDPEIDKNGNFIACVKETNGTVIFRDDLLKVE